MVTLFRQWLYRKDLRHCRHVGPNATFIANPHVLSSAMCNLLALRTALLYVHLPLKAYVCLCLVVDDVTQHVAILDWYA